MARSPVPVPFVSPAAWLCVAWPSPGAPASCSSASLALVLAFGLSGLPVRFAVLPPGRLRRLRVVA